MSATAFESAATNGAHPALTVEDDDVLLRRARRSARILYPVALGAAVLHALLRQDEVRARASALPDLDEQTRWMAEQFAIYFVMVLNLVNVVLLSLVVGIALRLLLRRSISRGRARWVPWAGRTALYAGVVGYVAVGAVR